MEAIYPVRIDPSQTLEELIKAGRYDLVSDGIIQRAQEDFSAIGEGVREIDLIPFHPNVLAETEGVEGALKALKLRPSDLLELIFFGAQYPDVQPVATLGSGWVTVDGDLGVPCIHEARVNKKRCLEYNFYTGIWTTKWRFLAAKLESFPQI